MSMPERPTYRPSGRASWGRLLLVSPLVLALAAGLAGLLYLVNRWGLYYVVVVPLLAALPLGFAVTGAVAWAHCRNRAAGAALGLAAGLVLALGHYYCWFVHTYGWERAHRLDLFPGYVTFRMNTDVVVDAHAGGRPPARAPDQVQVAFNWVLFGVETVLMAGVAVAAGWGRAGKPYGEEREVWYVTTTLVAPADLARPLVAALRAGQLADVRGQLVTAEPGDGPYTDLKVDHEPPADLPGPPGPAYLTVAEMSIPNSKGLRSAKVLARQVELAPAEWALLRERFPHVGAGGAGAGATGVVPAVVPPPTPASATVETIPEPLGGQVLTRPHLYTGAVLALLPAALGMGTFFGVLGLALAQGDDLDAEAGIAAIVIGFGAMGAALWWMVYFADFLPSRYLLRLARAAVAQRPDRLVEPDDPDAVFVQVIPRAHWGRMMLENAADVGFLRIDRDRRELLYEGDRERWVVPAAAVVTCAVESFLVGPPGQGSTFYVAVLRARVGSALWEAPFTRRHVYWGPRSQSGRERETRELALAVQALLGRG